MSVPSSPAPKQPPALNPHEQLILFGDLPTIERSRVPDNLDVSFLLALGLALRATNCLSRDRSSSDRRAGAVDCGAA